MQVNDNDKRFLRSKRRPDYETGATPVRVVDLFSGAGGLSLGIAEAARALGRGFELRLAMELDENIRRVFDSNFKSAITSLRADVLGRFDGKPGHDLTLQERRTVTDVGPVDILVGGPPCQGHSDLNNYSRRNDPKNELYMTMVRATEVLRPQFVIVENVQGVQRDRRRVLDRAVEHLKTLKYRVDHAVVHLAEIGVPQMRVRHVLLASRDHEPNLTEAVRSARVSSHRSLEWAIKDLDCDGLLGKLDQASALTAENRTRAQYLLRSGEYDLPNSLRPPCHRDNPQHRYGAMYGRLRWSLPAPTITTGFGSPGQGRYLHPTRVRTLTPHEAARIQFFPDWFDFSSAPFRSVLHHCIGNAVPSKLSFVLARYALGLRRADEASRRVAG